MSKNITLEDVGKFLEGRDEQKRIVNLIYNNSENFINVVYRNEKDQKCIQKDPFYPFLWATRHACNKIIKNIGRDKLKELMSYYSIGCKRLSNTNYKGEIVDEFEKGYLYLFYSKKPQSYYNFLSFFTKVGNPVNPKNKEKLSHEDSTQYLVIPPQDMFLIQTGKRFFKGYNDYNQILRMIFDLETEGLDPKRHRIKLNGVKLNRDVTINGKEYKNWARIFRLEGETEEEKDKSELKIIDTMLKLIYTFKPDVITAHNGENFDWNFLITRCEMLGTSMEEMSSKYFNGDFIRKEDRPSILKLGGEIEEFYKTIVPNTIVTDSLHAVRRAQATNSNFLQSNLKYATKFLGLKKKNRVYTPGSEIDNILVDKEHLYAFNEEDGDWYLYDENHKTDRNNFKKGKDGGKPFKMYRRDYVADGYKLVTGEYIINRYLIDDLWECDKVEYNLNGTDFMLSKILPLNYSKCVTMGTAGQWKAIMLAWSYENDLAIPIGENTGAFTGGLSRLMRVGHVSNVIKFDYNSLYPSIILTWGISDDNDLMNAMLHMLEYVLTTREKYKNLKKEADKIVTFYEDKINNNEVLSIEDENNYNKAIKDYRIYDNQQMVVKKLGNSFFGSYGSNNGSVFPWKSIKCAEQTTCIGRQCLRLMINHFNKLGYEPIVGDTDGFDFKLPIKENIVEPKILDYIVPVFSDDNESYFSGDMKFCIKYDYDPNSVVSRSIEDIINDKDNNYSILIDNEWVDKNDICFTEKDN